MWLLLAAVLLVRALVPQGYMAERDAGGTIAVKVCGAGHVIQVPLGNDEAPAADDRGSPPGAFAGLGIPVLPAMPAELSVPPAVEAVFASPSIDARPAAVLRSRPPARGPPVPA